MRKQGTCNTVLVFPYNLWDNLPTLYLLPRFAKLICYPNGLQFR